jgi:hypothetical protein
MFSAIHKASMHCPRLHQLLVSGVKQKKDEERLYKPITTNVHGDMVLRYWRYADFELDFMLAQQFNYEIVILDKAFRKDCKHIVQH